MQTDQCVAIRILFKIPLENLQLFTAEVSALPAGYRRIEHDDEPVVQPDRLQCRNTSLVQILVHDSGDIVVARQTADRYVGARKTFAYPGIADRTGIVYQVAGGQDQVGGLELLPNQFEYLVERGKGVESSKTAAGTGIKMAVGNLHQSYGEVRLTR